MSLTVDSDLIFHSSATISNDGVYRYDLVRRWGFGEGVTWVMLNPSTADGEQDDPTIRRCMKFTESWGYDCLVVVNLYAYRTPDPKQLLIVSDPVGPENMSMIRRRIAASLLVVAAWGAFAQRVALDRSRLSVESIAHQVDVPVRCLGTTKSGAPRHPLYVRGDVSLEPYGPWEPIDR